MKMVDQRAASGRSTASDGMRVAFEEHYTGLLRLSALLCGRADIAEDLVQEVFVRVADRIDHLAPDDIGPYLRKTAANLWKNRLRRLALERRPRPHSPVVSTHPFDAVEDRDVLWRAIKKLPDRQRICLVLRYYEDLREREVADALGCSIGTVKSQTSRALRRLRREIENET